MKSTKLGFKVWCTTDSLNGYAGNVFVYMGKSGDSTTTALGYNVVMELCKRKGYHVYSDNDFTSAHLAADLLEHGTIVVGTTQPDKVDFTKGIVYKKKVRETQFPQL